MAWLSLDPNWVAGVVMYWAEGTKTRNKFSMANTDPRVLRLFIAWVHDYVLPDAEFRLMLHLHEGNIEANAQELGGKRWGLPEVPFQKTFVKPAGTGHRKNTHLHGVCTVRTMRAADAWQKVTAWIDELPNHLALACGDIYNTPRGRWRNWQRS